MIDPQVLQMQSAKYGPILLGLDGQGQDKGTGTAITQLDAVRRVKNAVIGNRTKKIIFMHLGVIPKLVALLADPASSVDIKTQAAVVLGSFAHGNGLNIETLVQSGALVPLLHSLAYPDAKLVESCARALKAIFQSPVVPRGDLFRDGHVSTLVQLLDIQSASTSAGQKSPALAELAASIIARCCQNSEAQSHFANSGAISKLVECLEQSRYLRLQEAALDGLAELARENVDLARTIAQGGSAKTQHQSTLLQQVLNVHLHDKRSSMRLVAATFLTNIYRTGAVGELQQDMRIHLLPMLVKLFADVSPIIKQKATLVLAYLVSDSEEMQKAAADSDAIPRIAALLSAASSSSSTSSLSVTSTGDELEDAGDRLKESGMLALAALCAQKDECRKLVFDTKILPQIIQALSHGSAKVRLAACQCTRSLSRSAKSLRTSLIDAGVAIPLVKLLSDESTSVQATASATLCNVVLDFSPMKAAVLENGGVEKLASLVASMDSGLRLNAVWALKNLLFQADSEVKHKVMSVLTYNTLVSLMEDGDSAIQEQAVNLLRNLACGKESDIQDVFAGLGADKLMTIIDGKLAAHSDDIVIQALYVIVNVSTGTEQHKNAIMSNDSVLCRILRCMTEKLTASIRTATIWCVINLTWPDDAGSEGRVRRLRSLGFEEKLRQLADSADLDTDLKDRVRTAMQHFMLDAAPASAAAGSTGQGTADGSQRS